MPLVKRTVEPIFIGRSMLDSNVKNELEGVVINSLAGVIKQLSSLSKHAENLFGDLVNEANAIFQRSTSLGQRVQRLYERTSQLDSATKEDVKVEDFSFQHHFKSTRKEEQQILSRSTLPLALQEVYRSCSAPPDLNNFTNYRDDGKQGLKFYTDPTYFYSLWVTNQNKILDKKKRKGDKKKRKRKENQPKKQVKQVQKKTYAGVDVEFKDVHVAPRQSSEPVPTNPGPSVATPPSQHRQTDSYAQEHRPSGPAPQPTPAQLSAPGAPPPPPPAFNPPGAPAPPPFPSQPDVPPPPPPPTNMGYNLVAPPPPPPSLPSMQMPMPPPPVPAMPDVPAPPPPPISAGPAPPAPPPAPTMPAAPAVASPVEDSRSDLLRAIEMGKKLRKVERSDEVRQQSHGQDVASILKRRIVMEVSDTESDSDSDDSGSDWSD